LGLKAEPPQSFGVEGFEQLLRAHGPLWITADEDPSPHFSVHARVLIGLRGRRHAGRHDRDLSRHHLELAIVMRTTCRALT